MHAHTHTHTHTKPEMVIAKVGGGGAGATAKEMRSFFCTPLTTSVCEIMSVIVSAYRDIRQFGRKENGEPLPLKALLQALKQWKVNLCSKLSETS